ncbi:MAG TPA: hypothetical protein VFI19_16915, partial [Nocardioides sp.]|nr:hypothetical protein [Nocardioides sp.]
TTALAACLAALFAFGTACGTEHATAPARAHAASIGQLDSAKANQSEYLRRLNAAADAARQARAEHADAARWARGHSGDSKKSQGFGDDRRLQQTSASHPAGYNKALPSEW